jgi:hypothetical protein
VNEIAGFNVEIRERKMNKNKSQNALKHGAFSEAVILPGEDAKEFDELHSSLVDEWNPEGSSEHDKVMSVAKNMWRKHRFRKYLQNKIAKVEEKQRTIERFRQQEYDELLKVLEDIESGVPDLITEQNLSEKIGKCLADRIKASVPRKNYDDDRAWLSAVTDTIVDIMEEKIVEKSRMPSIDESLSDAKLAERELAFEERLDAKIDKDIKQLGQIKTMKAIGIGKRRASVTDEPLKQIDSPVIQAAENVYCNPGK